MLPAEQMSLITPEDSALERLHRDVRFVSELVADIRDSLPMQRRPLPEWVKQLHIRVTYLRRNGYCPCCQAIPVCDEHGKLPDAELDHWLNRFRNGPQESWLVCRSCNELLETPTFKATAHSSFYSYQAALRLFLTGQRELF